MWERAHGEEDPDKGRSGTAFGIVEIIVQCSHILGSLAFGLLFNSAGGGGYSASLLGMMCVAMAASCATVWMCVRDKH